MIQKTVLRQEVRRAILDMIAAGELKPGQRVNESALSRQLGVSRAPLREALMRLENEKVVVSKPGQGFRVRAISTDDAADLLAIAGALEALAMQTSPTPGEEVLERLEEINKLIENGDGDSAILDRKWHTAVVDGCENSLLKSMLDVIRSQFIRYQSVVESDGNNGHRNAKDHRKILEALGNGDKEDAARAVNENWQRMLVAIRRVLEKAEKS